MILPLALGPGRHQILLSLLSLKGPTAVLVSPPKDSHKAGKRNCQISEAMLPQRDSYPGPPGRQSNAHSAASQCNSKATFRGINRINEYVRHSCNTWQQYYVSAILHWVIVFQVSDLILVFVSNLLFTSFASFGSYMVHLEFDRNSSYYLSLYYVPTSTRCFV